MRLNEMDVTLNMGAIQYENRNVALHRPHLLHIHIYISINLSMCVALVASLVILNANKLLNMNFKKNKKILFAFLFFSLFISFTGFVCVYWLVAPMLNVLFVLHCIIYTYRR